MKRFTAAVLVCMLGAAIANAQDYRGEAIPVVNRVDPVEFSRLRFLTFTFGREGPMDMPLRTLPVGGREYFVEADISGIESAATIRFELVDGSGRTLQTLTMWKASDGSNDGEFYGFVTVPAQPFRAAVSGTGRSGAPFRSVLDTLFQPAATGPAEEIVLPTGATATQSARLQDLVTAYRGELKKRAALAASEHRGGVITLSRAVVSRIAYEPFQSTVGAPVGVRLRYSITFPSRQTIVAVPHVFPEYSSNAWRGAVEMKPIGGSISPAPQTAGVQTFQDVIIYKAAATYEAGTTYTFTVDMAPDYVLQGTQTGRFCIYEQKFTDRATWEAIKTSATPIPYSISIVDAETTARIPTFFPQRTFYQNFIAGGAVDCGPTPNIRF